VAERAPPSTAVLHIMLPFNVIVPSGSETVPPASNIQKFEKTEMIQAAIMHTLVFMSLFFYDGKHPKYFGR